MRIETDIWDLNENDMLNVIIEAHSERGDHVRLAVSPKNDEAEEDKPWPSVQIKASDAQRLARLILGAYK